MKRHTITALLISAVVLNFFSGCKSLPESQARPDRHNVISLAGKWEFRLDPNNVGIENKWYSERLTDKIKLPGSTAENGYGYEPSTETEWTGSIIDRSWFTDPAFEKYRKPGNVKVPFWLTPTKHYVGPAWYQRQIQVPQTFADKRIVLFLERCHWETRVWIDGEPAGVRDSLCTPHRHDLTDLLTPGSHLLTIRVDNSMKYNVGQNAHSVSDHTQSNWNGITGKIELQATDKIYIEDIQIYPDIDAKSAKARITIANTAGRPMDGLLYASVKGESHSRTIDRGLKTIQFSAKKGQAVIDLDCPLSDEDFFWDEFSGATYVLHIMIRDKGPAGEFRHSRQVRFGMRKFAAEGTQFTINNRPTFLRGTLECSIFPRTGCPPTDVEEWTRILRAAKAHGLNHIRFHSWCPPQAAFEAADREGIMFHVECPAWATIGNGKPIDKFIYDEGDRILKEYGNHPSFCMLAYGNEPGGPNQRKFLGELVNYWKQKDPRRLYTSAAGWPIIPESDFHSTPAPRGHQWGAGLRSRFNASPPETASDYSAIINNYNVPVVSHEIGQWCVYPNFDEIKKYTGVLKARNFEIFRDSLAANHMLDQAHDFLMASGKLQALLYKEEIESSLRTPGFAGFQLLDLHDFPGQGTALVGILDPFWESKGYVTAAEHKRYCAETVPLLRMQKRIWTTDETFTAEAEIAHFGLEPIEDAVVGWSVRDTDGSLIARDNLPLRTIPIANAVKFGRVEYPLADIKAPAELFVTLFVIGTEYSNDWNIWVYPPKADTAAPEDVLIADRLDEKTMAALDAGKSVLLMPSPYEINSDIPAGFTSIFWNTAWTRRQPPHTLGLLCDPKHPALARFPTEFHSDWQWWDLVTKSK
ncbi:MAG: sugar-binding domain-containing protein, partial [Planctomycetota bacterium]